MQKSYIGNLNKNIKVSISFKNIETDRIKLLMNYVKIKEMFKIIAQQDVMLQNVKKKNKRKKIQKMKLDVENNDVYF